ncbi:MAG: hypothetical protein ABW352_18780, partial [Polyangiales bacterium]
VPAPRRAPLRVVAASTLTIAVLGVLGTRSAPAPRTLQHELVHESTPPAADAVVVPHEVAPSEPAPPRIEPVKRVFVAERAPVQEAAVVVEAPVITETHEVTSVHVARPRATRTESSTLDAEVMQLRTAHDLLRDGQPLRALSALREHARRFPDGKLHELAAVTRVLALCDVGQRDEARRNADSFLHDHPRSVHASRVRDACK